MIIEKPTNRDTQLIIASKSRHSYPIEGALQVEAREQVCGKRITGKLLAVNESGLPAAILADGKIYQRCPITGYFYEN